MNQDDMKQFGKILDTIDNLTMMMYYNTEESPVVAAGLIRLAVLEGRKLLAETEELFPLLPEQEEALRTGGEVF